MSQTSNKLARVFRACLVVKSETPIGGYTLDLQFLVNPLDHSIAGVGYLTQATHPPLDVYFPHITGHYANFGEETTVSFEGTSEPAIGGYAIQGQMHLQGWSGGASQYVITHGGVQTPPVVVKGIAESVPC